MSARRVHGNCETRISDQLGVSAEEGLWGHHAVALMVAMAKCRSSVVKMLNGGRLHMGAEGGMSCEHLPVLVTKLPQRHWERQENRMDFRDARSSQIQHNVFGKPGREDRLRRGKDR